MTRRLILMSVAILGLALALCPAARAEVIVSLGDSYSSGEGVTGRWDDDAGSRRKCHRSKKAWPRLIGVARDGHFACSGAKMVHLTKGRKGAGRPDNVGQLERLGSLAARGVEVDTVLMTMGGNNMDFAGKLRACRAAPVSCLRNLDKLDADFEHFRQNITAAYELTADAAADAGAEFVVVSYPDLVPRRDERADWDGCGWLNDTERRGVWHMQDKLAEVLEGAARDADVDYVDLRDALDGRELCTRRSLIYPIGASGGSRRGHPIDGGQKLMGNMVRRCLDTLYADVPDPASRAACGFEEEDAPIAGVSRAASARATRIQDARGRLISAPSSYAVPLWTGEFDETYSLRLSGLEWRGWGTRSAVAVGTLDSCATGYGCRQTSVRVAAAGPRVKHCGRGSTPIRTYGSLSMSPAAAGGDATTLNLGRCAARMILPAGHTASGWMLSGTRAPRRLGYEAWSATVRWRGWGSRTARASGPFTACLDGLLCRRAARGRIRVLLSDPAYCVVDEGQAAGPSRRVSGMVYRRERRTIRFRGKTTRRTYEHRDICPDPSG